MIRTAVFCLSLLVPSVAVAPLCASTVAVPVPGDEKVLKAIDAWLKAYRAGKIDFSSREDVGKNGFAEKFGVLPKGLIGAVTPRRELEILLEQAVKLETADAAEAVLTVAAIGLDHGSVKYKPNMEPFTVRAIGEQWLKQLSKPAATDYIAQVARGEAKTDKAYGAGLRAAAIRLLGSHRDDSARQLCEVQLRAAELPLRLAAAEALGALGDERSGEALAGALASERSDVVIGAIADAMRVCFGPYLLKPVAEPQSKPAADKAGDEKKPTDEAKPGDKEPAAKSQPPSAPAEPTPAAMTAVRAAIAAIGRSNWRGDMQLLLFLGEFRSPEAVPALIGILQRFKDHPEEIQSGVLSTLLLHRAHELLASLTGAMFPADAPEKWNEFWQKEQQKLLAQKRAIAPAPKVQNTVAFCGMPVEGSRVLFIIDLSGSMEFEMRVRSTETSTDPNAHTGGTRLDFAKKQLKRAIDELPESTRVNFITFNGNPKAKIWNPQLLDASKKNKDKANEYIKNLTAKYPPNSLEGGTNVWAGLEEGLKMKTLVYGDRDEQSVDEIFVVSDGAPSAGEVVDPLEILNLVTETNRFAKIRLNTIFITSPNDRDPRNLSLKPDEFMRRLAEQNGGRFLKIDG